MAKVRYIGDEPMDVPLVGREVEPDELIEVPDAVAQDTVWPERFWRVEDAGRKVFDPNTHTVAEVNAYLAKADDEERARVLAAERDGQARKTVLGDDEGV